MALSSKCLAFALLGLVACGQKYQWNGSLEDLLLSQPHRFDTVMANPAKYRPQIIYTQIDRDANGKPRFSSFSYRVDAANYFYPASTVKLPTALIALEKLNSMNVSGVTRDTTLRVTAGPNRVAEIPANNSAGPGGESIGQLIQRIFLVSDNDAFNMLYDFVGQYALNEALHSKGYASARIMHRLEISLSVADNRRTNALEFVANGDVIFRQEAMHSPREYTADTPVLLGKAEVIGTRTVPQPKDFATKNELGLMDLHNIVQALMFPGAVDARQKFDLTEDDYQFVYANMSGYAADSGVAEYSDRKKYPDGFVKFLLYGGTERDVPENIRIFNKVGDAYGFLTDAAYIVDTDYGVEFILAASIYTNYNDTFNDNEYEYEEIGLPFLRDLGKAIYELELGRERKYLPDFKRFL